MRLLNAFSGSKDGATAVEYGLIAALIAVVLVAGGRDETEDRAWEPTSDPRTSSGR